MNYLLIVIAVVFGVLAIVASVALTLFFVIRAISDAHKSQLETLHQTITGTLATVGKVIGVSETVDAENKELLKQQFDAVQKKVDEANAWYLEEPDVDDPNLDPIFFPGENVEMNRPQVSDASEFPFFLPGEYAQHVAQGNGNQPVELGEPNVQR